MVNKETTEKTSLVQTEYKICLAIDNSSLSYWNLVHKLHKMDDIGMRWRDLQLFKVANDKNLNF